MSNVGQYLFSIIAAALLVSVSNTLIGKNGAIGTILKLVTGLVLVTIIVAPWTDLRFSDFKKMYDTIETDASDIVQHGQSAAQMQISEYIKSQTQAYILDKASKMDLSLAVDVTLTSDTPPSISEIKITGQAAPYEKQRLIQLIQDDLGVTEECLVWK